ncbi:MAG: RND family efflux transporter MFP subunit [Granulosicoccus sp.]|jgi:RND family efflux transporter MFP subunit
MHPMNSKVLDRSKAKDSANQSGADWLAWLGVLLNDRQWLGLFEFGPEPDVLLRRHGYPDGKMAPETALQLARKARADNTPMVMKLEVSSSDNLTGNTSVITLTALPLNDAADRILLIQGSTQNPDQQAGMFRLCKWANERLEITDSSHSAQPPVPLSGLESLPTAVLQASFEFSTPEAMALSIVNTVKRLCGCSRVSLATLAPGKLAESLSVMAMSDQAQIDKRKVLPTRLKAAMQEQLLDSSLSHLDSGTIEQNATIFPGTVRLYNEQGQNPSIAIVYPEIVISKDSSLLSRKSTQSYAVVLLERPAGQPFTDVQERAIQTLLQPSLDLLTHRMDEQRSTWLRVRHYCREKLHHRYLVDAGVKRPGLTLAICAVAVSFFLPIEHRFTARAAIEAKDLQVLIAPQNGFVATAHARAGEIVKKGQLLATLDTQDLSLAFNKWQSEKIKNEQAVDLALATRDRVSLGRLRADTARIAAEQALVQRQLDRAELRAPFDGVVLSGDFSQKLGSAVSQGDTLFTIAASNEYRLVLDIKEQDVGLVKAGQLADVRMSALPNQTWNAAIEAVLPVATSTAKANVFRVPARLSKLPKALLPGMEGVAKIHAGSHSVAWVYTRGLREKMKLLAWRMGVIR